MAPLYGKTCLVTGATSGIGKETAVGLAALGARVVVVGRDLARAADIHERVPGAQIDLLAADLASLAGVRRLADDVLSAYERIDVLVNNAGVISPRQELTVDGLELTFAVNHLAPFLLTRLLRDRLERSAPARVVTVASAAHKQVRAIAWDDLAGGCASAYPVSKLLNILFTGELARRLEGTGVTANCLHPGFVRTSLGRNITGVLGAVVRVALWLTPDATAGAQTSIYLASAPSLGSGGYYVKCKPAVPSPLARDATAAARLWSLSAELTDRWAS